KALRASAGGVHPPAHRGLLDRAGGRDPRAQPGQREAASVPRHAATARRSWRSAMRRWLSNRHLSNRCLSDDALLRVASELGTRVQHSHLTSCASCAMRYRRWSGELGMIRQVLVTTDEPRRFAVPSRLRTVAGVAALSAAAVAALLCIEVTAWKAFQP